MVAIKFLLYISGFAFKYPLLVQCYYNTKNTLYSCKKSCGQDLKKAVMKSKGGGQGLCRNAVGHIKIFDNDGPGHKTYFLPQFLRPEKNFLRPGSLSKFLMWSQQHSCTGLGRPFWFHIFSSQPFSGLGCNFFYI